MINLGNKEYLSSLIPKSLLITYNFSRKLRDRKNKKYIFLALKFLSIWNNQIFQSKRLHGKLARCDWLRSLAPQKSEKRCDFRVKGNATDLTFDLILDNLKK